MTIQMESFRERKDTRVCGYGYLRVSDPDQAERRASLEEQQRRIIRRFQDEMGIEIIDWYKDEGESAFQSDEDRDDFFRMVEDAKRDERIGYIFVDEETRFYRNRYRAAAIKGELLEYGIRVMTVTRPVDPRTVAGLMLESIEESFAQAHSMQNREYVLRGMAGNARLRDPRTGWAFKNGGQAPYGWKAVRLHMGHDSKGRPIGRTIWELDPPAAEVRAQVLRWRAQGWTYDRIRDELNRRGIQSPRGGLWSASSIVSMCREDMVWTAAGYTVWNKHYRGNDKPKGVKFKPTDQWVIEPNAHPAIITEEEARQVLAVNKQRRREYEQKQRKEQSSPYLIRGNNADGEPLFVCSLCGSRVLPHNAGRANRPKYVCSSKLYKGAGACEAPRVDIERLDTALVDMIRQRFTREYILGVIEEANRMAERERENVVRDRRQERLEDINRRLEQIQKSILDGADPTLWTEAMNKLGAERDELERSIAESPVVEAEAQKYRPLSRDEAARVVNTMLAALDSPDLAERRRLVVIVVRQLTLTPDGSVYADLHEDPFDINLPTLYRYGDKLVPPRGRVPITIL